MCLRFVVFCAAGDLIGAVYLLQQPDTGHVVGEGHGGHTEPPVSLALQVLVQAHAAADEEGELGLALNAEFGHAAAQLLAGAGPALDAQGDDRAALGQPLTDGVTLGAESLLYLRRGGIVGQSLLRQLDKLQLAVALEALDVLGGGVDVEFLLQLAHAEDGHTLHSVTSAS